MVRQKFNDLRLVVQLASSAQILDLVRRLHQRGLNSDLLRTCSVRVTEDRKRQRRVQETYEAVAKCLYNHLQIKRG
jgi:hypothetical protein